MSKAPGGKTDSVHPGAPATEVKEKVTTMIEDDINTVAFNETVRQGSSTKVRMISLAKMREGKARYKAVEGAFPRKDEMPTREQASAFLALIEERESVSVDFAIFGPHGDRLIKMRKFDTMVQGADGRMQKVAMLGPATYRG